jgi:hypothetical protein
MEALMKLYSKSDFERCLFFQTELTALKKLLVAQNRTLLEYSKENKILEHRNRDLKINNKRNVLKIRDLKRETIED